MTINNLHLNKPMPSKLLLERIHHLIDFIKLLGIRDWLIAFLSPFVFSFGEWIGYLAVTYSGVGLLASQFAGIIFTSIAGVELFDIIAHIIKVLFGICGTIIWWIYWRKIAEQKQRKMKLENDKLELDNKLLKEHIDIVIGNKK